MADLINNDVLTTAIYVGKKPVRAISLTISKFIDRFKRGICISFCKPLTHSNCPRNVQEIKHSINILKYTQLN